MAKVKVKFTKDFSTKKKGDIMVVDTMLASQLVSVDKVAVIETEKPKKK